ncbi:Cyclic di-GMP phosphodiesterase Gmr [Rubripirellula lacrimiformis]|uniref:Cyclic di-GMP phosphodiesterase Gmr n=1 Tax=Rubripirellula lacrimiformis TaxID=1930273 RepID=A0A517NF33_9BACT|nr:GGDEF domain-containing phosphodiesterase [Rubripirellula lacrimiformis]QDT05736.1 Cyclic di-GMP phosphodiesterase Gmr [Rubripirellula lacrimiformis]
MANDETEQPASLDAILHRKLRRILRRSGVQVDQTPTLPRWQDFLRRVNLAFLEYRDNRLILEDSVARSSQEMRSLYEELHAQSSLRLSQSKAHQEELAGLVQERTADLEVARLELEQINKRLEYDATHDGLTGVRNRSHFLRVVNARLVARKQSTSEDDIALYFIDFDRFKQINDTHGHAVGDEVLVQVANRLSLLIGKDDCLGRLGGDEFSLQTTVEGTDESIAFAQRICDAFQAPFQYHDLKIPMGASVGIVTGHANYESAEVMLGDADLAMYRAKETGQPLHLFDDGMRQDYQDLLELERELETAIEEEQFIVNFEPIVDIEQQKLFSIESLVRWNHPVNGMVSPATFIPLAEERGLVIAIDRIVFGKTCRVFSAWLEHQVANKEQKMNVNLASGQLVRSDLIPFLLATLDKSGLTPWHVVLEITESHLLDDSEIVSRHINELSALGFEIFIDDFGTGYSSLSYLAKYPIDGIKIDRAFIRDVHTNPEHKELIRSIVAMADALNVKVVTEGVETLEQLRLVTDLGCHLIQGFLFTKPMDEYQAAELQISHSYLDIIAQLSQPESITRLETKTCAE